MIYGLTVLSVLHFCSLTKKRDTLEACYLACTSLVTIANSCLFARVLKRACPIIHGDRKSMIYSIQEIDHLPLCVVTTVACSRLTSLPSVSHADNDTPLPAWPKATIIAIVL